MTAFARALLLWIILAVASAGTDWAAGAFLARRWSPQAVEGVRAAALAAAVLLLSLAHALTSRGRRWLSASAMAGALWTALSLSFPLLAGRWQPPFLFLQLLAPIVLGALLRRRTGP